jgi:hypothetical protein
MNETVRSSVTSDLRYIAEVDWDKQTGGNCRFGDSVQGLKYTLGLDKPNEFGGKAIFQVLARFSSMASVDVF